MPVVSRPAGGIPEVAGDAALLTSDRDLAVVAELVALAVEDAELRAELRERVPAAPRRATAAAQTRRRGSHANVHATRSLGGAAPLSGRSGDLRHGLDHPLRAVLARPGRRGARYSVKASSCATGAPVASAGTRALSPR